jgi:sugar phosphate permease
MAILGSFIHKFTLKDYITLGLIGASFCYMAPAIFYSIFSTFNAVILTIFMCLNGFFQATGWPGSMGIFGNWF